MTRFIRNNSGVAMIEFAVALPFLLILFLGMLELANYTIQHQKIDKVANAMADFLSQGSTVTTTDLDDFGQAVPQIMRPYNFNGTVIFSSAANSVVAVAPCPANNPCINWQYRILGTDASHIGSTGTIPVMPNNYPIISNQNVVIAEAFLHYSPILSISSNFVPAFTPQTIYKVAVFKPRQGSLTTLR